MIERFPRKFVACVQGGAIVHAVKVFQAIAMLHFIDWICLNCACAVLIKTYTNKQNKYSITNLYFFFSPKFKISIKFKHIICALHRQNHCKL